MSAAPAPLAARRCPVCGSPASALLCTSETIGHDLARARRGLDGFLHDDARAVYDCASCGSAFRDPVGVRDDTDRYARCRYRPDTLDQLRRRGRAELDRDAGRLRARGVVGGARLLFGTIFNVLTVLVLVIYFMAAFDRIKETAYALVPRSRRDRVRLLTDEILGKVGAYMVGAIAIAPTM